MAFEMALDVFLCFLQLVLYSLLFLWAIGRLPIRFQAVLDVLCAPFAARRAAPGAPAPRSPRRPLFAPAPPLSPPLLFSGPASSGFWRNETTQVYAWESRSAHPACQPATAEDRARFCAWYNGRVAAEKQQQQQKKTVRFAPEVQVQTIPSRHSVAHPEPAPAVARPPVVEPFDPVAWSARLEAFHEAISMSKCSLFPDLKLAFAPAAPVQQQAPVWPAEMLQPAPAPAAPQPPPPAPRYPPPSAPPSSTTTNACKPEMLQQKQPRRPPPTIIYQPPAVTPVQAPCAAAKVPAPAPAPAASTMPQQMPGGFKFDTSSIADLFPAQGLTDNQKKYRATIEDAEALLAEIKQTNAAAARRNISMRSTWHDFLGVLQGTENFGSDKGKKRLEKIAASLRVIRDVAEDDGGGLNENVFPRGDLTKMLLKGKRFDAVVGGFIDAEGSLFQVHEGLGCETVFEVSTALRKLKQFLMKF